MQNIAENQGVFNTSNENDRGLFALTSDTTRMGNRSHVVTTTNRELANALYEQALNIDVEPDCSTRKGTYIIEFIADDADCHKAIQLALAKGGKA